ncbi:type VII secretion integral membrane protein EccD [Schaalia vaccimaxillae]|uniref:type VII secretion integral membrane protein EccD n=1 Tax=Schaalia vaccimaxillae TaxID=183916 RepID=UPI0003F8F950|nr:type VII secretion integral membrane protein EccD [Schaalia vaccimaxillae]
MSTTTRPSAALMPISVTYGGETVDMSLPQSVSLAEAVPGMVDALGRMDPRTVSAGFAVVTSDGRKLDQSKTLPDQNVKAGAVLTLEPIGQSARDLRYDDLVEAVGSSVEKTSDEWTPAHSLQLSSHAAAALVLVAAVLMGMGPEHGYITVAIGVVGAALVTAVSAVVAKIPSYAGAISLLATAPVLMMAAGFSLVGGGWKPLTWLAGGIGALIATAGFFVLPARLRATMGAPLVLGLTMVIMGVMGAYTGLPVEGVAATALALLLIVSLSVPWFALAQLPVHVTGPSSMSPVDIEHVEGKISNSHIFVISLKTGISLAMCFLAPMLIGSTEAICLLACAGAALMLTTRSLRSRLEVLVGVITGMLLFIWATSGAALSLPHLVPGIVVAALAVAASLLAVNVVNSRIRPWLTRAANAASILVLLAILPLTTLVWGIL